MYYHVADASYRAGEDLWCRDELEAQGIAPAWKWEDAEEGFDGDVISLFETRGEAEDFRSNFLPDGVILEVDLSEADDVRIVRAAEGYPAALRKIPAHYIQFA